jgi:hypothetical protein
LGEISDATIFYPLFIRYHTTYLNDLTKDVQKIGKESVKMQNLYVEIINSTRTFAEILKALCEEILDMIEHPDEQSLYEYKRKLVSFCTNIEISHYQTIIKLCEDVQIEQMKEKGQFLELMHVEFSKEFFKNYNPDRLQFYKEDVTYLESKVKVHALEIIPLLEALLTFINLNKK